MRRSSSARPSARVMGPNLGPGSGRATWGLAAPVRLGERRYMRETQQQSQQQSQRQSQRQSERDTEFVEFVTAQRTALVRMARLLTAGDDAAAEDLVQTTLTRLYVHWPRVRRAGNPVGYARTSLTPAFGDPQHPG